MTNEITKCEKCKAPTHTSELNDNDTCLMCSLPPAIDLLADNTSGVPNDTRVVDAIKRDIKLAVKCGALPAGTKVSVRRSRGAYYSATAGSIDVSISAFKRPVFCDGFVEAVMDNCEADWVAKEHADARVSRRSIRTVQYSDDLNAALELVERIADRHNFNKSDYQTDYHNVGYYLEVNANNVSTIAHRGIKLEANKDFAELSQRAHEAAAKLGERCTRSICGRRGIEGADEWTLNKLITLATKANGRPVEYDKHQRRWAIASWAVQS